MFFSFSEATAPDEKNPSCLNSSKINSGTPFSNPQDLTDGDTVEGFSMYCNDFRKCEDGIWRISKMRIAYRKMNGKLHDFDIEEGWTPDEWEEWKAK